GGNRWTGYNWETNASNAGRDWYYQNDTHMGTGPAGSAVRGPLNAAAANDRALVVTVPINGYVAGDTAGPITRTQALNHSRFKEIVPNKEAKFPGQPLSLTPSASDGYVFTDEFVNWVEQTRDPSTPVFYSLDNEPGLWGEPLPADWHPGNPNTNPRTPPHAKGRTHGALHPSTPTFAELRDKTIAHAGAIKDVNPSALVFGGVGYGWQDFVSLQDAPDRNSHQSPSHPGGDESGEMHYYEFLLQQVAAAEASQGRTLMDVLDLHWYPEAQGGGVRITENNNSAAVVAARLQAPRSLWDPTYVETSWISQWGTWQGSPGTPGPVRLLPRVQRDIDDFKPGTKIAITEYNYGGTNHISGGIAQADVLGVFGCEGVFAANFWNLHGNSNSQFASGAFKMYLNYDGEGGQFGDTSIEAATDSIAKSAVYASVDADDPSRVVVVAINRTASVQSAAMQLTHDLRFDFAEVYRLTSASPNPVQAANIPIDLVNAFIYEMPAYSVSTLVLRQAAEGDFNNDGVIDADDLGHWRNGFGSGPNAGFSDGDNDRDGEVDGQDLLAWQRALGAAAAGAASAVPEPGTLLLIAPTAALLAAYAARQ
ncbi:MAG TPA: glycoside hydrolase family 44 protein, partial [Lacipirellula sp.]